MHATTDATDHKFNSDLLAQAEDLNEARTAFPRIAHVLDHPELRRIFDHYNDLANGAKIKSWRAGCIAILSGLAALLAASSAPIYEHWHAPWPQVISTMSALLGIFSVVIGLAGVLYAARKRDWLHSRLMTERLRQFHFQTLVCRWPDILRSLEGVAAVEAYSAKRKAWLKSFVDRFEGNLEAEFTPVVDEDAEADVWLLHALPQPPQGGGAVDFAELFPAYRQLRIMHQLHFAEHKLRKEPRLSSWTIHAQEHLFSRVALGCILLIFAIDISSAALAAFSWHFGFAKFLASPIAHVVVIWAAIITLAIRALEEGFQPGREIERYRHYRFAVAAIRDRFDEAVTPAQKLVVMADMERLSFDEMKDFLRTHLESRFVL